LDFKVSTWHTGLCDICYDKEAGKKTRYSAGVWVVISAQFVFYMAQEMLRPLLYKHLQTAGFDLDTPAAFALVMGWASTAAMMAPIFVGFIADRFGPRLVYCMICLGGGVAAAIFACRPSLTLFAAAWAMMSLPASAVRGVRAAFFARHVDQRQLSEVGNLASNSGLMGGFSGPLLAAMLSFTTAPFFIASLICLVVFWSCSLLIFIFMPGDVNKEPAPQASPQKPSLRASPPLLPSQSQTQKMQRGRAGRCERCHKPGSSAAEALCRDCYDNFGGKDVSFWLYSWRVMICCWILVLLLEIALNAGVMVAFQPVVVERFGWESSSIALVNTAGAGLGMLILIVLINWKPREDVQAIVAAGCYLLAVLAFMCPPLAQWRLVVGVMLGVAAQIMFYPALEALFARKLGKLRVTMKLAVILALAAPVGTALGTALSPLCVAHAGSAPALLAALPALLATLAMGSSRLSNMHASSTIAPGPLKEALLSV